MYTELEDEFGDIVGKARRGQEITVEDLAREFEPCAATIRAWIKQADRYRHRPRRHLPTLITREPTRTRTH